MEGSDDSADQLAKTFVFLRKGLGQKTASVLHVAASNGNTKLVKALLNAGVAVNTIDEENNTALHLSARNGHTVVLTMLLNAKAITDMKDCSQCTALHMAAAIGYTAAVRALLSSGASVNMMNELQNKALHLSAVKGHTAVVKTLLNAIALVDSKGRDCGTRFGPIGSYPLMQPELDSLLDHLFEIFYIISGFTPLMAASFYGHLAVVELLVCRSASLNSRNIFGWTALNYANMALHPAIKDYLISKGTVQPGYLS